MHTIHATGAGYQTRDPQGQVIDQHPCCKTLSRRLTLNGVPHHLVYN